jgi:glucose-6-phosphate 1-dehydrogenase
MVIFGGTGDLAMRKLLPALYYRHKEGHLPRQGRIIGAARSELSREQYLARVRESAERHVPAAELNDDEWRGFAERVNYLRVDARSPDDYRHLAKALHSGAEDDRVRVFFLSTGPDLFVDVCENLGQAGLISDQSRVVLEKPLGRDLVSAQRINQRVGALFVEDQIFRIDHYLGKETVQNLMALRFGNTLLENLWGRNWIRDVQITVAEQVGAETRGEFYNRTGALRDMVQNHLLQLLCIFAMEPPTSIDPYCVRDEKLKVLRALKPITETEVTDKTVRGQYRAGAIAGQPVRGYLEEEGVPPESMTETFVALKTEISNWRWEGVPFYLRTGKRLQEKLAEIVVNYHPVPHSIFGPTSRQLEPNRLVMRLEPDEGVKLFLLAKRPGDEMKLRPVSLNLDFAETFKIRQLNAYERLLMDIIRGKLTLFIRREELEAAWRWIDPILNAWQADGSPPKSYTAGTWGPAASSALISRDGCSWAEER